MLQCAGGEDGGEVDALVATATSNSATTFFGASAGEDDTSRTNARRAIPLEAPILALIHPAPVMSHTHIS